MFDTFVYILIEMPQGTIPVFEEDGTVLCESMAIARHLARKFGKFSYIWLEM